MTDVLMSIERFDYFVNILNVSYITNTIQILETFKLFLSVDCSINKINTRSYCVF